MPSPSPAPQGPRRPQTLLEQLQALAKTIDQGRVAGQIDDAEGKLALIADGLLGTDAEAQAQAVRLARKYLLARSDLAVLSKALTSGPVLHQLKNRFGVARVEAALSDPVRSFDELFVMAFQAHRNGMLRLGPQVGTIFSRILAFARRYLGIITNSARADAVLTALTNARSDALQKRLLSNTTPLAPPQQLTTTRLMRTTRNIRAVMKPVAKVVAKAAGQSHREMDRTGNTSIIAQRRKFLADVGERNVTATYHEDVSAERPLYHAMFQKAIGENTSEEDFNTLMEAYQRQQRPTDPVMAQRYDAVSQFFQALLAYARRKGVNIGDQGPNFFPLWLDPEQVAERREELTELLLRHMSDERLQSVSQFDRDAWKKVIKTPKVVRQLSEEERRDAVERLIDGMLEQEGKAWNEELLIHTPYLSSVNARGLDEVPQAELLPYVSKDYSYIVSSYINHMVKRANFAKRWDNDGSGIIAAIKEARALGATDEEIDRFYKFIEGQLGTLAHDMNPKLRKAMGWATVFENYRLLVTGLFSSLPDVMGLWVRSGSAKEAWRGARLAMRDFVKQSPNAAREAARLLGVIDDHLVSDILAYEYAGTYLSSKQQQANDLLFKFTGQSRWTGSTRVAGTALALDFLREHGRMGSEDSVRMMEELGLKKGDVGFNADGSVSLMSSNEYALKLQELLTAQAPRQAELEAELAKADRVRTAVHRYVNSAILRPNAATRPTWMNDPRFMLLGHMKGFNFSFWNTIMRPSLKRAKDMIDHAEDMSLAERKEAGYAIARLAMYVPVFLLAEALRDALQHLGDEDPNKRGWGALEHFWFGLQRSGLMGPLEALATIQEDIDHGSLPGLALAGPTIEHGAQTARAFVRGDETAQDNALFKMLPFQGLIGPWRQEILDAAR